MRKKRVVALRNLCFNNPEIITISRKWVQERSGYSGFVPVIVYWRKIKKLYLRWNNAGRKKPFIEFLKNQKGRKI